MAIQIDYLQEFSRRAKALAKKYKSFTTDYDAFILSLEENPFQGISLGGGVYKTRMAIASKGKGKSGGARVLTYNVRETDNGNIAITLMSIFDKGEMENVSDSYIESLVQQIQPNQ